MGMTDSDTFDYERDEIEELLIITKDLLHKLNSLIK